MAKKTIGNPEGYSAENPYKYNPGLAQNWEKSQEVTKKRKVQSENKAKADKAAADAELAQKSEEIRKRFAGMTPQQIESVAGTGPKEMQDILAQRKAGLAGFNAPQLAAMQAQMAGGQQAAEQQRNRALQASLARQGVRGGAAASLQAQAGQMAAREKAAADTQLMLQQAAQQEKALGAYEQGVSGALGAEQARQFQGLAAQLAAEQQVAALEAAGLQKEATESYGTSIEKAASKGSGGCCTILAMIGAGASSSGISEAKANDIVQLSKNKNKDVIILSNAESKLWDDLFYVRAARDNVCNDKQRRGYYIFSEMVEPLIKKSEVAKNIGYSVLVTPLVSIGKENTKGIKANLISKIIGHSWIKFFGLFSSEKPFVRKNGEVV
jgi:hypothetical protein